MLNAADAFIRAARMCSKPLVEHGRECMLGAPPIVCGALSIELYLKLLYLLTKEELAPASHSLLNLFNDLNGKTQETCARYRDLGAELIEFDSIGHLPALKVGDQISDRKLARAGIVADANRSP
jgi:hypothetical protein